MMTPEHLGAIIRLFDPNPEWENWVNSAVTAWIVVGGLRCRLSHAGHGKEKVEARLYTNPQRLYFDDALELMAYLERLRE